MKQKQPKENKDYYLDKQGRFVLTREFLLKRGFCCGNGCKHCPYGHMNVKNKKVSKS